MKVPAPMPEPSISPEQEIIPDENNVEPDNLVGDEIPQDNQEMPFGKEKFDAGIDVDEDADPKKYIEKLTGKLAQKLRDYNETNDDIDLNKFVINSLIPASIPEMDDNDAQDVIKKVKDNIGNKETVDNSTSESEPEIPSETEPQPEANNELPPVPQEEAKKDNIDDLISELIGAKKLSRNIKNKDPFKSKKFK